MDDNKVKHKYYNQQASEQVLKDVIDEYGNMKTFFECVAYQPFIINAPYEKIRQIATFISHYGYDHEFCKKYDCKLYYDKDRMVRELLNQWFNIHLPDNMLKLYMFFDDVNNKEKWNGEERFKLLSLTNSKGYSEMQYLKAAVRVQVLQDEHPEVLISLENIVALSRYLDLPYWSFDKDSDFYRYDPDESEEDFNICNHMIRAETKAQNDFIDAIFKDKDIYKAYMIMPSKDKIDL